MARIISCAILLACFISQASANIIEINFTGTSYAIESAPFGSPDFYAVGSGLQHFSADFVFDTDKGVLSDHRLDGGLISAFITLDNFGTWGGVTLTWGGGTFAFSYAPWLTWNDALTQITAVASPEAWHSLWASNDVGGNGSHYGSFQFGNCPTRLGGPCGYMTALDSMTITGIPGPIVGAGIPGLLLTIGGLLVYHRRNRHQP